MFDMSLLNDCRYQITNVAAICCIAAIGKFSFHVYLDMDRGKHVLFSFSSRGISKCDKIDPGGAAIGFDISSMPGLLGIQAY